MQTQQMISLADGVVSPRCQSNHVLVTVQWRAWTASVPWGRCAAYKESYPSNVHRALRYNQSLSSGPPKVRPHGMNRAHLHIRRGKFPTCAVSTVVTGIVLYENLQSFACLISFLRHKLLDTFDRKLKEWFNIEISMVLNLDFLLRKRYKF